MEQITIRFAKQDDIAAIMSFLDENWKRNHILARDKEYFSYQHVYGEEVTYVLAIGEHGEILGTLGYIPYGQEQRDVMTVMWKVLHTSDSMLGIKLLQYLIEEGNVRSVSSPGINKKTVGIYKFLGYHVGEMKHWYRLRKQKKYQIAHIVDDGIPFSKIREQKAIFLIDSMENLEECFDWSMYQKKSVMPYKEKWYIERRYFHNPKYKYKVFGVNSAEARTPLLLIFRVQEYLDARILRLIDCIGDYKELMFITDAIDELLEQYNAEYVDLYETGIKEEWLMDAGWTNVESGQNIIPEYFSPYSCENVNIVFFSTDEKVVLFKGDGDQDRPN